MWRLALVLALFLAAAASARAAGPLDEIRRSFTLAGKPIPPDVFRDFGDADLGDSLPSVVAIDVKAAIDSERYGVRRCGAPRTYGRGLVARTLRHSRRFHVTSSGFTAIDEVVGGDHGLVGIWPSRPEHCGAR